MFLLRYQPTFWATEAGRIATSPTSSLPGADVIYMSNRFIGVRYVFRYWGMYLGCWNPFEAACFQSLVEEDFLATGVLEVQAATAEVKNVDISLGELLKFRPNLSLSYTILNWELRSDT